MARGEITRIREAISPMPGRNGRMDMEVHYSMDGQGDYTLYIPLEEFTPTAALKALQEKTQQWAAVVGKFAEVK